MLDEESPGIFRGEVDSSKVFCFIEQAHNPGYGLHYFEDLGCLTHPRNIWLTLPDLPRILAESTFLSSPVLP